MHVYAMYVSDTAAAVSASFSQTHTCTRTHARTHSLTHSLTHSHSLSHTGKCISTDGLGASASFAYPYRLAMDERGRLLVAEAVKFDSLRMVEAGLAPPPWSEWEKCGLMLAFMGVFHARLGAQSTAKPLAALGSDDVVRGVLWPLLVRS